MHKISINPNPRHGFTLAPPRRRRFSAFTLVEMLVVVLLIGILSALLIPAFTTLTSAKGITNSTSLVVGVLEQARTYAMANNTYAWVGFFEEDAGSTSTASPRPAGTGAIVISIVASRDGNRYKDTLIDSSQPHAFYPPPTPSPSPTPGDYNPVILTQVQKLLRAQNVHLAVLSSTSPPRPNVPSDFQVGATNFQQHPPTTGSVPVTNPTTFNYPLSAAGNAIQYTFVKTVEFGPRGEAIKIVDLPAQLIEIGLQPTHGTTIDGNSPNTAAIQVDGATGKVRAYHL